MIDCVMSEMLKLKRTFCKKLIWVAPLISLLLCAGLGAGETFQIGSYNWWYTIFIPGSLSIICANVIDRDKKLKYNEIFTLSYSKSQVWLGKIFTCSYMFFLSCIIFVIGLMLGGLLFGTTLEFVPIIEGTIVIFITFIWQIPLCMIISVKFGMIATVLLNYVANVIGIAAFAAGPLWHLNPYSIPTRLMCPILNILPNGLPVESGSSLANSNVILEGIFISIVCFIAITGLTSLIFNTVEGE